MGSGSLLEFIKQSRAFLEGVFGAELLQQELEKLGWRKRGRPEEYGYLREVRVHEAARCGLSLGRSRSPVPGGPPILYRPGEVDAGHPLLLHAEGAG